MGGGEGSRFQCQVVLPCLKVPATTSSPMGMSVLGQNCLGAHPALSTLLPRSGMERADQAWEVRNPARRNIWGASWGSGFFTPSSHTAGN